MLYKVKLKNASETVLLDDKVYEFLTTDPYLVKVDFINNLRRHSSGCAVFQKTWAKAEGGYKTETIYLHKLVAEKFLYRRRSKKKNLVGAINGNKLDCRLENLVWRSRSVASRQRKTSSKSGYTGVYKENNRYRAVISINRKSVHIGMFDTAEEAAQAYNEKSQELYGDDGKVNVIKKVPKAKKAAAKAKKAPAKAKATTKAAAKKTTAKAKTTAKKAKPAAKKATAKKATAKKAATKATTAKKKTVAKKATAKKTTTRKKAATKTTAKAPAKAKSTRGRKKKTA